MLSTFCTPFLNYKIYWLFGCGDSLHYCVLQSHYESGRNAPKLWMLKLISFNVSFRHSPFHYISPVWLCLSSSPFFLFSCLSFIPSIHLSRHRFVCACVLQLNECRWTHNGFTFVILEAISAKFNFNVIWLSHTIDWLTHKNHIVLLAHTNTHTCTHNARQSRLSILRILW